MWQAETGQHVDGVIAVDVEALHQILEVTGPVTLHDGTSVNADDVVQVLTHDQYEGLIDNPTAASRPRPRAGARTSWGPWPRVPCTPWRTSRSTSSRCRMR